MKKSSKIDEDYIEENADRIKDKDIDKVFENEHVIKDKLKHLYKIKDKIRLLFQLLKDYRSKKYTATPWLSIASIIFALLYVLNPLDIIPDFIPLVGYIDDASVLAFTLKMIGNEVEDYEIWLSQQETEGEHNQRETA